MVTLVTGATGTQGNAVAQALLRRGRAVRALVRDTSSPAARCLAAAGADLAAGSFEDSQSLLRAMEGINAVFSVQPAPGDKADQERQQAHALVGAACKAGVRQVVHSSVSNSGDFRHMTGWTDGRWDRNYWESKAAAEETIRAAGLAMHTILRPAFMMDNFALPKASWMFPDLAAGEIVTAIAPDVPMVLVAAEDIGQATAAAIEDPGRFAGQTIELAGELLTLPQIAATISQIKDAAVTARTLDADSLIARGQHSGWVQMQQWMNVVNYPARPEMAVRWGLVPTRFADWAKRHAALIQVA